MSTDLPNIGDAAIRSTNIHLRDHFHRVLASRSNQQATTTIGLSSHIRCELLRVAITSDKE